ncbi:hypothetical protein NYO91_15885 [Arhodomonas aquaeolei]|uniref:hypothetical protein n=1 Tax=Arhodomonas aquaeolei TaxID=2369 RepID=UPI002167C7F7|nr:hypothetical protein [Arhodomonas aquaeolei]MCS4505567.1 hypothetical protein [Arhodomonas aquaeolei]
MSTVCRVVGCDRVAGGWWWLRLTGIPPDGAAPGRYCRITHDGRPAVLPLSHASAEEDWIGGLLPPGAFATPPAAGTRVTADPPEGDALATSYPDPPVIVAEGIGAGPALALAERCGPAPRLVLIGCWQSPPARLCPSRFLTAGLPPEAIAGIAPLEDAGIPARVASRAGEPGCFEGEVMEMLQHYLAGLTPEEARAVPLAACLPAGALATEVDGLRGVLAGVELARLPPGDGQ